MKVETRKIRLSTLITLGALVSDPLKGKMFVRQGEKPQTCARGAMTLGYAILDRDHSVNGWDGSTDLVKEKCNPKIEADHFPTPKEERETWRFDFPDKVSKPPADFEYMMGTHLHFVLTELNDVFEMPRMEVAGFLDWMMENRDLDLTVEVEVTLEYPREGDSLPQNPAEVDLSRGITEGAER